MAGGEAQPIVGIDWPVGSGGKTTATNKAVWAAAATAAGEAELAQGIEREKDWRFGYVPYLERLGRLLSTDKCKELATAGIAKMYEDFVLRAPDGTTRTLAEVDATPPAAEPAFRTETVAGQAAGQPVEVRVPYKTVAGEDRVLGEEDLLAVLKEMSDYGTHEKDVDEKVKEMAKVDLTGRWFALLGAGSELGPFRFLMERGANVIAVRTRRQAEWQKMKEFAASTRGTLYMPVDPTSGEYGVDILAQPLQIRDWILSIFSKAQPASQDLTIGAYTYLDGEANVRVGLGCDLIMSGLERLLPNAKVRLAFIGSTGISCAITKEMSEGIDQNRADSPLWMRATGCPSPSHGSLSGDTGLHMLHGYMTLQGPNYALAKVLVLWRVLLARHVSYNNGPPCRTANMVKNPTLKVMLEASSLVKPYQTQDPEFASQIMGLLLAYDVVKGKPEPKHPLEKAVASAFHGGTLRFGFNLEGSTLLQGLVYMYGRFFMAGRG